MTEEVVIGDVVLTRVEPKVIVNEHPDYTHVSLAAIQASDPRLLFISGARLYLGNNADEVEVIYEVTGWDDEAWALTARRVQP